MYANTPSLLSLYEFATIMQLDPWDLAQVGEGFPDPNEAQCTHNFYLNSYPHNYLSRNEVAATIEKAEAAIAAQLGYWPAPKYIEETVGYPRPADLTRWGSTGGGFFGLPFTGLNGALTTRQNLQWKSIQLSTGYINGGGIQAYSDIDLAAAVTRDGDYGDGIFQTFTVGPIATTVTDPAEIGIYFTVTDRQGFDLDETWRVRPVKVALDIVAGTVTITGSASLLVNPALEMVTNPVSLDVTDASTYVTEVEVHRVYRDTTATQAAPNQGWALWEPWTFSSPCSNPPCTQSAAPVYVGERNATGGQAYVTYSDPTLCTGWRDPDRVHVKYLAGKARDSTTGRMDRLMADIVAHLATAWLPVDKCGCERSDRIIHWWRSLPTEGEENSQGGRPITYKEIDTPFGERRGATFAWSRVKKIMQSGVTWV